MIGRLDTRLALRARLLTVAGLPAVRHFIGDEDFAPPTGQTAWLRETLLPSAGSTRTVGLPAALGEVWTDGEYQVDLFYPAGQGEGPVEAMAETICRAFRVAFPDGVLAAGSGPSAGRVTLQRSSSMPVRRDGPWLHVPVLIRWQAEFPNLAAA